ncbi:hypothetical protein ONZ45_g16667 [Pleurotus djamor]|nr:hypothetical protein ONZ45_g16667 [Pleurotus djamor]
MTFFREGETAEVEPIWDMVPYTSITRWENARFVTIRRYWKGDFDDVQNKLSGFLQTDDQETFIAERKSYVEGLLKHSKLCMPWLGHLHIQAEAVRREKRAKFVNDMKARCIDYGFSVKEVDRGMNRLYRLDPDYELTDNKWQTLLPQIVAILKPLQKTRAVDDEAMRVQRRKDLVSRAYASYIKTLPATKWHYTPFEEVILQDLYVMIHDGSDHTLDDPKFKESHLFPRFAESTRSEAWRMRKQLEGDIIKSGLLDDNENALKEDANIIDRAFAVFVCPNLKGKPRRLHCLIAWTGIWSTINYLNQPVRTIRFAAKGYQAVKAIADLLEVDSFQLLPSELDRLNLRVVCNSCPFKTVDEHKVKDVLTWREYVGLPISADFVWGLISW